MPAETPEDVLETLRHLDLVANVAGGVLVVRSPGDAPARVIGALVWPIVEMLARAYAPAVVERDSAVRLYLGRTDPGPEIRIRQTGQTRWRAEIAPGVVIRVERGDVGGSRTLPVGEAWVPVDTPEDVLLSLPLQFLREGGLSDVALWMKSLVLSRPALTDAYRRRPRPVVLKRMEHIAGDVGNESLGDLLAAVVSEEQSVRIGRDRTGIGRELVIPPLLARSGTSHQPWLDLDEVSALLGGGRTGGPEIEDVRSKLAVLGYGIAFDRLLRRIQDAQGNVRLTGNLALDLYVDLFTPSVEAGIVPSEDLSGRSPRSTGPRDCSAPSSSICGSSGYTPSPTATAASLDSS